jgi:glycosyltransferase involved in cell wall biosynthesis
MMKSKKKSLSNSNSLPKKISQRAVGATSKKAIFTVVSNNYLHFARTLLQSAKLAHPDCSVYCVIVDTDLTEASKFSSSFNTISLGDLALPGGKSFLFQYTVLELNTAVKPWAIEHLLDKGYENVIYIDPDIYVYRPLEEVVALLRQGSDIVVTPHLLAPITDEKTPSELDIRRSGTYNFGFCAVRKAQNTYDFLHWWQSKLTRDCVVDLEKGIFVDQSWIDLVPGLFDKVSVLRHPGYNVAYWNIAQRKVERLNKRDWTVNGQPLVFFHYSGFNPVKPEPFSKHQNRYTLSSLGQAGELARAYAAALIANGAVEYAKMKYGYGLFANGTPVPDIFRSEFRNDDVLRTTVGNDPFACPEALCFLIPSKSKFDLSLTYSLRAVWNARRDLQQVFNLTDQDSIVKFYRWFLHDGANYFSASVLAQHYTILNSFLLSHGETESQPVIQPQPSTYGDRGTARVYSFFENLLERPPEPSAIEHYAPMCETAFGTIRAWRDISTSKESRQKAQLPLRMLKAITAKSSKTYHAISALPDYIAPTKPAKANPAANATVYSGFYTPDADTEHNGLWVSSKIVLPFNARIGHTVTVKGVYLADFIEKQNGDSNATMTISVGDAIVEEFVLRTSGEFTHSFQLPDSTDVSQQKMYVQCSKYFVPKDIGLNLDERELAWRIKLFVIGDATIVNTQRPVIFLPQEEYLPAPGVNLVGYLAAESGVGEAARLFAKAAYASAIPYSIVDVGYQNANLQRDKSAFAVATNEQFDIDVVYVNADQTTRTLDHLKSINHKSRFSIGFWHWEQPKLPNSYLSAFEGLTEVWTPSAFVQDAVAKISPIPVYKVPHAIDFSLTPGTSRRDFGLPHSGFLVLVMYDFHSYQYRKNPEAAVAAFRIAAANKTNVSLVIKTINADKHPEDYARLRASVADMKNVVFLDKFLTRQEVYNLESCCDTLISLHRAEGFGLALAEMMYLGKPVIATGWSANMEFMTPMNSLPVHYTLKQLETTMGVYEAGQNWAEADVDHAAECLSLLIDNPDKFKAIGKRAANSIREQLSPEVIGRQYRARLALIGK